MNAIASEARFEFLVGRQRKTADGVDQIYRRLAVQGSRGASTRRGKRVEAGSSAGDEAAIVAPVKSNPRGMLPRRLILQVRGLVEEFVMVNAENAGRGRDDGQSRDLRQEEAGGNAGHNRQRRKSMVVGHTYPQGISRDLGIVPLDREVDRRGTHVAEVVAVVRVLPNVVSAHHQVSTQRLLQAGM